MQLAKFTGEELERAVVTTSAGNLEFSGLNLSSVRSRCLWEKYLSTLQGFCCKNDNNVDEVLSTLKASYKSGQLGHNNWALHKMQKGSNKWRNARNDWAIAWCLQLASCIPNQPLMNDPSHTKWVGKCPARKCLWLPRKLSSLGSPGQRCVPNFKTARTSTLVCRILETVFIGHYLREVKKAEQNFVRTCVCVWRGSHV